MVVCLGWGADLHMVQQMPLPLTISCSSKSRLVLPFWYWLIRVVPDQIQKICKMIVCACMHACTSCTSYWIHTTCTNKCLHHFLHATLYPTAFPVYPLLTSCTLYWIITNTYTTDSTWPSYSLLCYFLLFPTNHNLSFIIPPPTVVAGGILFYCWSLFFFLLPEDLRDGSTDREPF